jgi:hypothetical protein
LLRASWPPRATVISGEQTASGAEIARVTWPLRREENKDGCEPVNALPEKILLATDGSEDAALAARIAADLSTRAGGQLHVMHAWHTVPSTRFESFIRAQLEQEAREVLSEHVGRTKDDGGDVAEAYLTD